MKSIVAMSALAATLFSIPALADSSDLPPVISNPIFKIDLDPLPSKKVVSDPKDPIPGTGAAEALIGGGLLAGSIALGIGALDVGQHSSNLNAAWGMEIGSIATSVAGSVLITIGAIKSMRYYTYMAKHPWLQSLQVSPTSAGYRLVF